MRQMFGQMFWIALSATAVVTSAIFTAPVLAGTFVYVGNAESNEISVLQLNRKTGELTLVETVTIPGVVKAGMSTPIAISPDRRFLYAATRVEPQAVFTFSIEAKSGKLKYIGNGPLVDSMAFIATDRTGKYLLAASYQGHKITVNPIGPNQIIQPTSQVLENHTNAHSILPDNQNRFVLAMTLGNDLVNVFKFEAKIGRLSPHTSVAVAAKTGPRHFVFHPNGRRVYVLGELDATIHVFDWDARQGQLKETQAVSGLQPGTTGRIAAADLHLTPDGKFIYASERTSNTLACFKINPLDGTLSLLEFVPTESQPRSFSIDSSGRYLLVAGQRSNQLSSYKIDSATGKLTKLKEYPMGKNPSWVEIIDLPAR